MTRGSEGAVSDPGGKVPPLEKLCQRGESRGTWKCRQEVEDTGRERPGRAHLADGTAPAKAQGPEYLRGANL